MSFAEPEKLTDELEIDSSVGARKRTNLSRRRVKRKSSRPHKSRSDRPKLAWLVRPQTRTPLFAHTASDATSGEPIVGGADPSTLRGGLQKTDESLRYLEHARRPIASLYFLFPLIMIYEVAKIFIGPQTACSGIDHWICELLSLFGAGQLVILPMLMTAVLLVWHHRKADQYGVSFKVFPMMASEALGMGLMLFLVAHVFLVLFGNGPDAGRVVDPYHWTIGSSTWWSSVVTYIGTGIHEELIFRVLIMLPLAMLLAKRLRTHFHAAVLAAVVSSLLFATAHIDWFNPAGEPFHELTFLFRFVAAGVFATVFHYRGFGIAVGTHITYNVLTLLSN